MDDLTIIDLYWQRKEEAVTESKQAYGTYCYAIAHRILADRQDCEECVSDTWLRAWNAIPPERPRNLKAFFGRITRNLSLDRYAADHARKRGGGALVLALEELNDCISRNNCVEQVIDDKELEQCMNRFLHALPMRERNIFLSRYWAMLPLKDAAVRFGMKENAVKASLYRSRKKLKKFLEQEGIEL